jgi:putative SOS response-associated peptidase YedK
MPVILNNDGIDHWINSNTSAELAISYLTPFENELKFYPVSSFVNSPRNNSESCIQPLIKESS